MVPKGFFLSDMKVPTKGLSWVDLMCQKFEAICEGVDKSPPGIIQETTRLIDQISTVGVNMQKLCSDFMDDILPPITEIDDKLFCAKYSAKAEEELNLTDKSDPGEDIVEFSSNEDVDKNASPMIQEATKSIPDQTIMAGENLQNFSSNPMEDVPPLAKNNDDVCPSSKLSANADEDFENSDPEKEMGETMTCENVGSSDVYQEADATIEIQMLDVIDQLNASCIKEENISAKPAEDLSKARTIEYHSGADASERLFDDIGSGSLQERNCLQECAESLISQNNMPLELDGKLVSNRTGYYSGADAFERLFDDKGSLQKRNCLQERAEPLISKNDMPFELDGELLSNRTGVVGVTEQAGNAIMDLAGSRKSGDHPSPGETLLSEDGILVALEEYENVEQNLPDDDVERGFSAAEPYTATSPACSKEGNFKRSLYLAVKEKEQLACWHGNPQVQDHKDIGMSSSNSFVNITDSCRWPDVESSNSDSEWELL